jgi:hypothetical protein
MAVLLNLDAAVQNVCHGISEDRHSKLATTPSGTSHTGPGGYFMFSASLPSRDRTNLRLELRQSTVY